MDFGHFLGGWLGLVNELFVVTMDSLLDGLFVGLFVGLVDRFGLDRGLWLVAISSISLLIGFKDFLESSDANTLDNKHFSSNAGDAICRRCETKYHKNESERSLCQISHDICTKGTISVPSVKTGQGDGKA